MKILQKSQIQEADRQTICLEPIASIELMERAAKACFQWICQHYNTDQKFTLLCGTGNNGGDGLALYRMLRQKKYSCTLFEFPLGKTPSEDYSQNKLKIGKENINALTSESLSKIQKDEIIIDALLGTSDDQILQLILEEYMEKKVIILSPLVKARKGHYMEEW